MPDPYQEDMNQLNQAIKDVGAKVTEKQTEFGARLLEIEQKMVNVSARRGERTRRWRW